MPKNKEQTTARKREFADRLRSAIDRKGWTPAETVQAARRFLAPTDSLAHAHISHYLNARAIPRPQYLRALSRALDVTAEDLLGGAAGGDPAVSPNGADAAIGTPAPGGRVAVRDADAGEAWIEINQRVPWSTALEILKLLKADQGEGSS